MPDGSSDSKRSELFTAKGIFQTSALGGIVTPALLVARLGIQSARPHLGMAACGGSMFTLINLCLYNGLKRSQFSRATVDPDTCLSDTDAAEPAVTKPACGRSES